MMNRRTLLAIILYLGLFWLAVAYAAFGQSDSCIITGKIYRADGSVPARGAVVKVLRTVVSGSVTTSLPREFVADSVGNIRIALPRSSTAYLYSQYVPGLSNAVGTAVTIPNTATATLSSIIPATSVPISYIVAFPDWSPAISDSLDGIPRVPRDTSASAFWNWSQTDTSGAAYWTGQAASWRHPAPRVWNVDLENVGELESVYAEAQSYDVIHITSGPVYSAMVYPPIGKSFYFEFHGMPPTLWPGTGGNWNGSSFAYQSLGSGALFSGDTLSYCVLTYTDMSSTNFDGAYLDWTIAKGAVIDGASFIGATMNDIHWENVIAMENGVAFFNAYLVTAAFKGSKMTGAAFIGANCTSVNFALAELYSPAFTTANLTGALFIGTKFWFHPSAAVADYWGGAIVDGANFTGSTGMPDKAAFKAAVASYDSSTIWTDGLPITTTTASDTVNQVRKGAGTLATPDVIGGVKRFNGPILSDSYLDVAGNGFFSGRIKAVGFANRVDSISYSESPYTVTTGQYTVLVNTAGGAVTVNLPLGSDDGTIIILRRIEGSNNVTVQTASYVMKVEGANTYTISSNTPVRFVKKGTKWWLM